MAAHIQLNDYQSSFVLELQSAGVRFLVLGGIAIQAHGLARETHDLDVLIDRTVDNCERIIPVIAKRFRNPPPSLTIEWLSRPEKLIPLPSDSENEIDIISSCGSLSFEASFRNRLDASTGQVSFPALGLRELIYSKLCAADRNSDPRAIQRDVTDLGVLLEVWQSRHSWS